MSQELPEGWTLATPEDLSQDTRHSLAIGPFGSNLKVSDYAEAGVPLVFVRDIRAERFGGSGTRHITAAKARDLAAHTVRPGDLLVTKMGEPPGDTAVYPSDRPAAIITADCIKLSPNQPATSARFLKHCLRAPDVRRQIAQRTMGVAQQKLSLERFRTIQLPLPPVAEQHRIVARIEELLAHLDAARERLARIPAILKGLRRALFAAACSGKLTEDWRHANTEASSRDAVARLKADYERSPSARRRNAAAPSDEAHDFDASTLPASWELADLAWLCEPDRPITYGILKPGPDLTEGVPYIRVADFPEDSIRPDGIRRTSRAIAEQYRRASLREGDLLLSIRGTYGRVCRVPAQLDGANITQDTARLTISRFVNADYVAAFLRSAGTQDRLRRAARGVAVRGVNIGDVRALQVPVPPPAEQAEIVRRIDAIVALLPTIDRRTEGAAARSDALTHAVLAKAFRGELVPTEAELARAEGRDYESAKALLARIQAERVATTPPPKVLQRAARRGGIRP